MESFWGTLKSELACNRRYRNIQEAIQEIDGYIEIFTTGNDDRQDSGYLSHPLSMSSNSMPGNLQHERIDVHYDINPHPIIKSLNMRLAIRMPTFRFSAVISS